MSNGCQHLVPSCYFSNQCNVTLINLCTFTLLLILKSKFPIMLHYFTRDEKSRRSSSRPEGFFKEFVLENFTKFTGKHLCQNLYFIKLQASVLEHLWRLLQYLTQIVFAIFWIGTCGFIYLNTSSYALCHGLGRAFMGFLRTIEAAIRRCSSKLVFLKIGFLFLIKLQVNF